ncbi:MAG TPA: hypothetical protein VI814_12695 [Candidatus Limnocylindria bacterium]
MDLKLDPIHALGYVGALGSLVFGTNQLLILVRKHRAKDVSTFDYAVRTIYSVLLGIYSIGIANLVFVVVNFGAAVLSAAVMVAALRIRTENRSARARKAAAHRRDAA